MKVLILGASGMAGHTITLYFKERGHEVVGFSLTPLEYCDTIVGDVRDFSFVKNIIIKGEYDAIINAIGILNESAESNKALAVLLNSYLPHFLTETTKNMKTKILQMSTDCVFSGKSGSYSENSFRDGESFYDRSKALGEIENSKDITFRNSIIGPDMNENGIGLFNWFMKQKGKIKGYSKVYWTGVTTLTLAKAMEKAIEEDLVGIYNLVNNEKICKFDMLTLFNKYIKHDELDITPYEGIVSNKSLVNNRTDFSFIVPSYDNMISDMAYWILAHKEFYPHYYQSENDKK